MRIISFHTRHDANVSVVEDNKAIVSVELERVFNDRYFQSSDELGQFKTEWQEVLQKVFNFVGYDEFDLGITNWVMPSQRRILMDMVKCKRWETVDHHLAHASLGFYDSGFKNALIISYDGGGNDGVFNIYLGEGNKIRLLEKKQLNLGTPYKLIATQMDEITHGKPQPRNGHHSLSGKLMGYCALGNVNSKWHDAVTRYFQYFQYPAQALYTLGNEIGLDLEEGTTIGREDARDLAATAQSCIEQLVLNIVEDKLTEYDVDGIVFTGGCALNILINTLTLERFGLPVHMPPAPNDGGISLGSIWALHPPTSRQNIAYIGLPLEMDLKEKYGMYVSPKEVAELLCEGAILGVARGRSEFGPRALGNRSILCLPESEDVKKILNDEVKFREWFRPFAPMVPFENCTDFFEKEIFSPYMSFTLPFKNELRGCFPAVEHLDGTSRLQTVRKEFNPWLHELLLEVGRLTGYPILLNTSFNSKGKPLINNASTALELLRTTSLSHVLIEDSLIKKEEVM
ncbi:MAG: carbamoyltransferase [Methanolobus sp.]|jgi:carbamoyltransferase|nr:carbamoyltransferase [Methanolobus sp.]